MADPLILYSTNTWLSYMIAQHYYRQEHYVWCTPIFSSRSLPQFDSTTPPSSSPSEIYKNLAEEVRRGDRHSARIKENKVGILRGASFKKETGIIGNDELADIAAIVEEAEIRDFRPLLYVIPFGPVSHLIQKVAVTDRAHPLSVEHIIERLPRACFDIIEWEAW